MSIPSNGPLVLVIEDEQPIRRFLRATLESQGYRVKEAETAAEGLLQVRSQRPDNRRMVFIHLTPKGRLLKSKLVPLAEEVNALGIRGIKATDISGVRRTLLAMLDNLAADEPRIANAQRRAAAAATRAVNSK